MRYKANMAILEQVWNMACFLIRYYCSIKNLWRFNKAYIPHTSRELPSVAFLWFNNIKLYLWIKMRYRSNMTILEQVYILDWFLILNGTRFPDKNLSQAAEYTSPALPLHINMYKCSVNPRKTSYFSLLHSW